MDETKKDGEECLSHMEALWPQTAVDLLKARYEAFQRGNVDFIINSHHPDTRQQVDRKAISDWSKTSQWLDLSIQDERAEGEKAHLLFTVRYERNHEVINHQEWAEFRMFEGKWYYYDSEFPKPKTVRRETHKVGRNDPCSCGSGQKFKKCHGA